MLIAVNGNEANVKRRVGSNQYAFELLKAIHQQDQKNEYLICLANSPLPDLPKERKNWQYKIIGPPKLWNIFGFPHALYRQQPKPDVVFNPGHYSPLFSPAPLVVSIMDLGYLRYPGQFTRPILLKLKFWTSLSIKRAAHILAISESTKNDIIEAYGVSEGRVTVTYPGYDRRKFKYQISKIKIEEVRKKYKISGDYILFLSTLKPSKNIEGLLEAFKLVTSDQWLVVRKKKQITNHQSPVTSHQSPISLVIAGRKGWLFKSIFEKVKELGLENRVIFTGFVDEEDVPALMSGAKVFVLPSFWEGFGIPVIEAMACGTPVVVSNAGSLPEIAGDAGIVVDPHKPADIARGIKKILYDISIYDKFRQRGLVQAKKFSWEKCAQKTIKVLEKVGGE